MDLRKLFNLDQLENQITTTDPMAPSDWRSQFPDLLRQGAHSGVSHIGMTFSSKIALELAYDIEELIMLRALFNPKGDPDA